MKVFQFPLIKITIFFVLGILFGFYFAIEPNFALFFLILGFMFLGFTFYKSLKDGFQIDFFGISALFLSFFIGNFTQIVNGNLHQKNHYVNQIGVVEKQHLFEVSLKEKLKNSISNNRYIAIIQAFDGEHSSGKIILNIRKDSSNFKGFQIGNILKFKASVYKNKPPKNPYQFDYGKYLENQNIYAQVYCDPDEVLISSKINKNIWYYAANFRNTIINNLAKSGFSKKELAVVVALILGQQQDISPEILQDYQFAGAVHILSVSGLHVGFIMLFVGYLLKPFPNTKKWKINKLIIVVLSLWLFGFVAGLAPSVLRSVVMFSFVAIGRYLGRGVNIYNTLLVSALIILLIKPSFLFDVGFQLSYVSLFFIIWLQPLIADLWEPKNKISKFFWDILSVSFAAQIGAMGLSIYYFHQFPGLFFITNMIVLPFMGIILGFGVFVLLLAYYDIAPIIFTKSLEYSIWILDKIISWIASFEQFIFTNISMNKIMLLAMYLMIFGVVIYFKKPTFKKLILATASIIIFQITIIATKYYHQNQKEFIAFHVKKHSIMCERSGQNTIIYANDSTLKKSNINNDVNQYLVGNFSRICNRKEVPNLLFFNKKKILILDSLPIYPQNLTPDILLISHSPKLNLERFLKICKPKIIVADGSNYKSYVKVWSMTCQKAGIDFHDTSENGFFRF